MSVKRIITEVTIADEDSDMFPVDEFRDGLLEAAQNMINSGDIRGDVVVFEPIDVDEMLASGQLTDESDDCLYCEQGNIPQLLDELGNGLEMTHVLHGGTGAAACSKKGKGANDR